MPRKALARGTGEGRENEEFPFYAQLKRALRRITTDIAAHVAASDPHPGYITSAEMLATKLDDWAAPDDNTDLNASTLKHGLLPKLDGTATKYLDGSGAWSTPAGSGGGGGGGFPVNYNKWDPDAAPSSAGADDDEFADAAGAGVPSGWTEVDHGTVQTVSEESYGLKLIQSTHAGDSVSGIYKAIPVGDFTIVTKVMLSGLAEANFVVAGLGLFQDATSSTGDIVTHTLHQDATATAINVETWTAYNTFGSSVQQAVWSVDAGPTHVYLRIRRTGTTYAFDFSTDGTAYQRLHSGTLSFTPTHYGPIVNNVASGADVMGVFSFFRYLASDVGIVGVVGGNRITSPAATTMWAPDAAPASPNSEDDEFDGAQGAGAPTGWTEIDHGSHTTVSEEEYGLRLSQATHAGNSLAGVYKAIPAGDFTMWTKVHLSGLSEQNTIAAGMGLLQDATSSTGDMVTFSLHQNGTQTSVTVETRADYATFTATVQNIAVTVDAGINMVYLRVRRSGTTYAFDFSTDGLLWQRIHSGTISFTPAHIGLLMNNENTGADAAAAFRFFRYTASDVGITGVLGGDRIRVFRA